MSLNDHGKLIVIILCVLTSAALMVTDHMSSDAGIAIISAALGYVTGNGVLAVRSQTPSTMLTHRGHDTDATIADATPDA